MDASTDGIESFWQYYRIMLEWHYLLYKRRWQQTGIA
jgi:hypothetical protein